MKTTQKDISIEYAHIYTNNKISEEQKFSLGVLNEVKKNEKGVTSIVVLVDDYSFPDPSFDYHSFSEWLTKEGFKPDVMLRESQLIPVCDEVLKCVQDIELKDQISDYVRAKKYPCSLFIAGWYLLRLGYLSSPIFDSQFAAKKLINILPISFKPFEDKALEIIESTKFALAAHQIENKYFEGRLVA